ncbi:hypothetical protein AB833_20745 [Chromatiales bacterium (ex Bugula neritina AB1)]|nr:hypothetical protein AB833_20745 [Chromatiales bacterium (ex Bugula neritina AB1)]
MCLASIVLSWLFTDVVFAKDLQLEFQEISAGIYVHFGRQETMTVENYGDIANIGFIVGEKSIAVIDPGGSPAIGTLMRKNIESISPLPISHVILTHFHPDHVFGGSAFTDVPVVVAHRNYTRASTQRAQFYREAFSELFIRSGQITTLIPTDDQFDTMRIELGGRTIEVRQHETGHTDNDLSVWDVGTATLWASDLLFVERLPSLDGSVAGWIASMNKLAGLSAKTVIPGHGVHGSWDQLAAPQFRYLNKLLAQTRAAVADNRRLSDAVNTVAADESEHWLLFESRHPGNVTKAFTELEWE